MKLIESSIRKIKDQYGRKQSFSIAELQNDNRKYIRKYVDDRLEFLGAGSSRRVYVLNSKKVLKLATNEAGIEQNKTEYNASKSKFTSIVTSVYDAHPKFYWIVSDLVRPLSNEALAPIHSSFNELFTPELQRQKNNWGKSEDEFEKITNNYFSTVHMALGNEKSYLPELAKRRGLSKEQIDKLFLLKEFQKQFNISSGDLFMLDHWGKTPDGRVVILDYGLSEDVYVKHYRYEHPEDEDEFKALEEAEISFDEPDLAYQSSWERPAILRDLLDKNNKMHTNASNRKQVLRMTLLKEAIRKKRIFDQIKNKSIKLPFSMGDFKNLEYSEDIADYLMSRLELAGEGSSRMVFIFNNKYVIKVAKNPAGMEQNKLEFDISNDPEVNAITTKVEDADKNFMWIMSEIVRPLSQEEFAKNVESDNDKMDMLETMSHKYQMDSIEDIILPEHWGKTNDQRYVLLDYGINDEIFDTYY